jgi:outer membrane protein assembly factor BamA
LLVALLSALAVLMVRPRAAVAKTRFIPLPMYTTVPNEGSTYGVMPVFMVIDDDGDFVRSITAPSLSWNQFAGVTATFRHYLYFSPVRSAQFIASASTELNRNLWVQYDDVPRVTGEMTYDFVIHTRQNIFYRFFGFGPDTTQAGESSYTRFTAIGGGRVGYNFAHHWNAGVAVDINGDRLTLHTVGSLPATQIIYPTAPGLNGDAILRESLSLRYDTRPIGDYSETGFASEINAAVSQGLSGSPSFLRFTWHTRFLMQQKEWLQGGARLYWTQLAGGGSTVPFYQQASLGGDTLLRGFNEDRFIDRAAWEIDIEERFRFLETHFFGVFVDWRIDPFITAGQVSALAPSFSNVRVAGGIGLRAWVKPNVLGRIDLAWGGEGIKAYVVLGYPY